MTLQLEMLLIEKMLDILPGASKKIVDAKDVPTLRQEPFAKMRAKKARSASHQYPLLQMHQAPG